VAIVLTCQGCGRELETTEQAAGGVRRTLRFVPWPRGRVYVFSDLAGMRPIRAAKTLAGQIRKNVDPTPPRAKCVVRPAAGKIVRCPKCQTLNRVPNAHQAARKSGEISKRPSESDCRR
jgi:hypothetical protein